MSLLKTKQEWMDRFHGWISELASEKGKEISHADLDRLTLTLPPAGSTADFALGCFVLAKSLGLAPQMIAQALVEKAKSAGFEMEAVAGYANFTLDRPSFTQDLFTSLQEEGAHFGHTKALEGRRIMIEFSGPNANKPLHLGHLRNNALGESLSRILVANGADVYRVNIVNNRGVHICKSMLAYEKFGNGQTPEQAGRKSDHYVGDWYVRYSGYEKENPEAEKEIGEMLQKWEAGDPATMALWEKMTKWAVDGMMETYKRTRIRFDKVYYESDTYLLGKDIVMEGLEKGVFYKREDGAIVVDLPWHLDPETGKPGQKVLLRGDGTSIYLTQDLGNAVIRRDDYAYDSMIYVVGSEQDFHFKVLFYALSLLGYEWASQLYHLSYGMVELPTGKMKSREGTIVDADNLIDEVSSLVQEQMADRGLTDDEKVVVSEGVAQGALNYFLLNASPTKNIMFKKEESIAFTGNTGPYLQYTTVRLHSLQAKAQDMPSLKKVKVDLNLLETEEEWTVIKKLSELSGVMQDVALERNPAHLTRWAYNLCKAFNQFYQGSQVVVADNPELTVARLALCQGVLTGLTVALELLNIPILEKM